MGEGGVKDLPLGQGGEEGDLMDWTEKLSKVQIPRRSLNKLVINYLVTEGFKGAAQRFQEESGVQADVDLDHMDNRIKIREDIQNGKIEEAINGINELQPALLDENRYLLFHLQQQRLIEYIREGKVEEALDFATNHLAERGEEDNQVLQELERTLALLAFEEPLNSPFADLLSVSHRQQVGSEVNEALLKAEHVDSAQSKLATNLKFLIWAQDELDKKKVRYPHLTDLSSGKIDEAK